MTTNPFTHLERTYKIIARRYRRSGETWADTLIDTISRVGTTQPCTSDGLDLLVHAVAAHRTDTELSDRTIRSLVAAEQETPDAFVVLLQGLAPVLQARLGRATAEYRTELLSHLALVIRDASRNGELNTTSDLARRLTNRAHSRGHRRGHRRVTKRTDHPRQPDWFTTDAPSSTGRPIVIGSADYEDFTATITERLDLARFTASVQSAVAAGEISEQNWQAYQAHRLGRALDHTSPKCTSTERSQATRTARQLQPHIKIHLSAHAL